jgi:hypothetical protein
VICCPDRPNAASTVPTEEQCPVLNKIKRPRQNPPISFMSNFCEQFSLPCLGACDIPANCRGRWQLYHLNFPSGGRQASRFSNEPRNKVVHCLSEKAEPQPSIDSGTVHSISRAMIHGLAEHAGANSHQSALARGRNASMQFCQWLVNASVSAFSESM